MERWNGRVALVTGASAGIGEAIAKILVRNGMRVVGCARRLERLEALAGELNGTKQAFFAYQCDLTQESEIREMFSWVENHPSLGKVDACVANAGIASRFSLLDGNYTEWKKMMDVNVLALGLCTQLSIKSMLKHKVDDGQIVLVNSICGHRLPLGKPLTRMYTASKHAVTMLMEGFRQEIREHGNTHIRIGAISPGVVKTEIVDAMFRDKPEDKPDVYSSIECLSSEDMADNVLYIFSRPEHVQINDIIVRSVEQLV